MRIEWLIAAGVVLVVLFIIWFLTTRLLARFRARIRRMTRRALLRFRVKLNRSKLSPKHHIRDLLLKDPIVEEAILEYRRETDCKFSEAEQRVEEYIDEIVPNFQLFWYYVVGHFTAKLALNLIYRLDIGELPEELAKDREQGKTVVYVANHRSNVDYVLMSYALTGKVALSYAVGEWARVWPLESLFKAFGSYFIRRGYREKLYHTVLRRYVQVVTEQGITQGVFIEGGLSRNGFLRPAKVGMLDYLTQTMYQPNSKCQDIVIVPIGLNYDRVLEDRPLTNEYLRRRQKELAEELATAPEFVKKSGAFGRRRWQMLLRTWRILFSNLTKYWSNRLRKHGTIALRFGKPVSFKEWQEQHCQGFAELDRKQRLVQMGAFGEHILGEIARIIPATPVTVFCAALVDCGLDKPIAEQQMREQILKILHEQDLRGGSRAPVDMDRENVLDWGRKILSMRGLIVDNDEEFTVPEKARIIVEYYAASLQVRNADGIESGQSEA